MNIFTTDQASDFTTNWDLDWVTVPEGISTISIEVRDLAGNTITHNYQVGVAGFGYRKDTTMPEIEYNGPSAGANTTWYTSDPGAVLDIDFIWVANSPLDYAQYKIGDGAWVEIFGTDQSSDYSTDWSIPWASLQEGLNIIHIKVADKAGNILQDDYLVNVAGFVLRKDSVAPVPGSISINAGAQYTNSTTVTLTISATDATSGIYQMRLSNDGIFDTEPWETYSTTKQWTLSSGDGKKTVYIMFRDNAMLESLIILNDTIIFDNTPPKVTQWLLTPADLNEDWQDVLNITVNLTDGLGSGILKVEINYSINGYSSSGYITMAYIGNGHWSISIDPDEFSETWDSLQTNTLTFHLRLSDKAGNLNITADRTEYIDPVNDPPEITSNDVLSAKEGELYTVSYTATDIDPVGDTLSWSMTTNASSWLSIDPSTGVLSGTPGEGEAGTYWVNVTVSDGHGGVDWHYFILTVTPQGITNQNPVITTTDVLTITAGNKYSVDYEATDDRTPVVDLTWSLETNASWLSIDFETGVLSGTPLNSDAGTYWVKITVGDGEGGFASRNFTLKVTTSIIPNNPPKLTNGKMTPSSGDTDTTFTFSVDYQDDDSDPPQSITVVIDGNPHNMDLASGTAADGSYEYNTKLSKGAHSYYFTANDGTDSAGPGDTGTPTSAGAAVDTDEINEAETTSTDNSFMFIGIIIVIIIVILLVMFMVLRGRGGRGAEAEISEEGEDEGEGELEGEGKGPRIVGPVDSEGVEAEIVEEEEEYPYDEVSTPDGYEDEGFESELAAGPELGEEVAPLRPEVKSLELEREQEIIELGLVMPCSVCQGIMPMGERAFQCTCGLVSHKDCMAGIETCPQCGKTITIPELTQPKARKKLPMIRAEVKREVEEQKPPMSGYFIFVPGKNTDKELSEYIGSYYRTKDFGELKPIDELRFVRLFITPSSAKIMLDHCYKHGRVKEVMGLMIGQTFHYKGELFSVVKDVVTSELDATEVNVKFDSFEKLFDQLDQIEYDYQIIGWYHSHPNYSSFMSPTDADTQARMFKHPYQYAIVIDPIRMDMNAFTLDLSKKSKVKEKPFAIVDLDN